MEYTKRRNLNRGYMKLDAWRRGKDLFSMAFRLAAAVPDFKLRSQFRDAVQSVSANIGEGYGRRSLLEYIQFLYFAKGSLAESLTRAIGFHAAEVISGEEFEKFDKLHLRSKTNCSSSLNRLNPKNKPTIGETRCHPKIH